MENLNAPFLQGGKQRQHILFSRDWAAFVVRAKTMKSLAFLPASLPFGMQWATKRVTHSPGLFAALAIVLFTALNFSADASTMFIRNASGELTAMDLPQHRLVLQSPQFPKPLTLAWHKDTRIFFGSEIASASALARGQYVRIGWERQTPGPAYASIIFIISPGAASKPYERNRP